MNRREAVLGAAAASCLLTGYSGQNEAPEPSRLTGGFAKGSLGLDIYFETHGKADGPNVFLAVPLYATTTGWPGGVSESVRENKEGYIRRLGDRYRLLIADYPYGSGQSAKLDDPARLTVEQVCSDYLAIADAAKMDRFAAVGYSWGGNSCLQLATRSSRVNALAVGGWPALGGPYDAMLELSGKLNAKNYFAYYQSLKDWSEREAVAKLACPRLNYLDTRDTAAAFDIEMDLIGRFRKNRPELQALGWDTAEVESGKGHGGGLKPPIAGPVIRSFLDKHFKTLAGQG